MKNRVDAVNERCDDKMRSVCILMQDVAGSFWVSVSLEVNAVVRLVSYVEALAWPLVLDGGIDELSPTSTP